VATVFAPSALVAATSRLDASAAMAVARQGELPRRVLTKRQDADG
jgi:hypothetical protein